MWAMDGSMRNAAAGETSGSAVPPLVDAMMRPEFYRIRPLRVELKQTHISYRLCRRRLRLQGEEAGSFRIFGLFPARPAIPLLPRGGSFERAAIAACVPRRVRDSSRVETPSCSDPR